MAYECFHGNNDSLSWLDGPTYGHAAEGKESSGDHIWLWGDFFISYLHSRKSLWCETTFIIWVKQRQKVCMCVKVDTNTSFFYCM